MPEPVAPTTAHVSIRIGSATAAQVAGMQTLADASFTAAAVERHEPPEPTGPRAVRFFGAVHRHLHRTDPERCLAAADESGRLRGVAVSSLRGSGERAVWGLALLAVDPTAWGSRLGTRLLQAALATAPPGTPRVFFASSDPRALRAYARSGHQLLPCLQGSGIPDRAAVVAAIGDLHTVREAEIDTDAERVGLADQAVDLRALVEAGGRLLVTTDGAPAAAMVTGEDRPHVRLLAADDQASARRVLAAAVAGCGTGLTLTAITAAAGAALDVAVAARLDLGLTGPAAVANAPDPLTGLCLPPAVFV